MLGSRYFGGTEVPLLERTGPLPNTSDWVQAVFRDEVLRPLYSIREARFARLRDLKLQRLTWALVCV